MSPCGQRCGRRASNHLVVLLRNGEQSRIEETQHLDKKKKIHAVRLPSQSRSEQWSVPEPVGSTRALAAPLSTLAAAACETTRLLWWVSQKTMRGTYEASSLVVTVESWYRTVSSHCAHAAHRMSRGPDQRPSPDKKTKQRSANLSNKLGEAREPRGSLPATHRQTVRHGTLHLLASRTHETGQATKATASDDNTRAHLIRIETRLFRQQSLQRLLCRPQLRTALCSNIRPNMRPVQLESALRPANEPGDEDLSAVCTSRSSRPSI